MKIHNVFFANYLPRGEKSISGGSYANYYAKIRTVYLIMDFIQQTLQSMQTSI